MGSSHMDLLVQVLHLYQLMSIKSRSHCSDKRTSEAFALLGETKEQVASMRGSHYSFSVPDIFCWWSSHLSGEV